MWFFLDSFIPVMILTCFCARFFVLPAAPLVFCLVRVVKNEKFAAFTSNFFPRSTFFIIFINSISQEWLLLLSAALFGAHQCCCYVSLDHTIEHTKKKSSVRFHFIRWFFSLVLVCFTLRCEMFLMPTDIIIIKSYELFSFAFFSLSFAETTTSSSNSSSRFFSFSSSSCLRWKFRNFSWNCRWKWNEAMYATTTAICVLVHHSFHFLFAPLSCTSVSFLCWCWQCWRWWDLMWMMMIPPLTTTVDVMEIFAFNKFKQRSEHFSHLFFPRCLLLLTWFGGGREKEILWKIMYSV